MCEFVDRSETTDFAHDSPPPHLLQTIQELKKFGESTWETRLQWPAYESLSLNEQRISDLLDILTGEIEGDFDDDWWVPVHAWRILAANKVKQSIPLLVDLLVMIDDDDDWSQTELPEIIAMFGPSAIPLLRKALLEETIHGEQLWGYTGSISTLGKIVAEHPGEKSTVAEILRRMLSDFELNPPTLNSFLISELVDLEDVDAIQLVQKVFARRFLDERVIDWDFVVKKLGHLGYLPETIKTEKYNPNDFYYSGDERFQKLLKSLGSIFNIDELKLNIVGTQLAIDVVQPTSVASDVLTNIDDKEIDFDTDGQALYFYREFFGLWNELSKFQNELFELPDPLRKLNDLREDSKLSVALVIQKMQLISFMEGLRMGETEGDRLEDGDAAEFMLWLEDRIDALENFDDNPRTFDLENARNLLVDIQTGWRRNYLQFAKRCKEVRLQEIKKKKFVEANKDVGRNEPCPCGSGKKFKKCCLAVH